jgi:hypothetical protein
VTAHSRTIALTAVLAATTALALPAAAGAKAGDRTFQKTYPLASSLCARVAANTVGKQTKRVAPAITADCAVLQSSFTTAQSSVLATRAALTPTLTADRAALNGACAPPPGQGQAACQQAHKTNDAPIAQLGRQLRKAARAYYRAIESARLHFWNSVHALRGQKHLHADAPIPQLSN